MSGGYFDMEAFFEQMLQDCRDLFGAEMIIIYGPHKSVWQRLKEEIANRPRVV